MSIRILGKNHKLLAVTLDGPTGASALVEHDPVYIATNSTVALAGPTGAVTIGSVSAVNSGGKYTIDTPFRQYVSGREAVAAISAGTPFVWNAAQQVKVAPSAEGATGTTIEYPVGVVVKGCTAGATGTDGSVDTLEY